MKSLIDLIKSFFNMPQNEVPMKHLSYSKNNMTKTHIISGATLILSSNLEKNKEKVRQDVEKIVRENFKNLYEILTIAENEGCNSYFIQNADKILSVIKEESGLIFPKKGFEALLLNLVLFGKFSFKTDTMFIFDENEKSPYNIIYSFYKWYSFKSSLPGFDEKTLKQFKKIYEFYDSKSINKLSYEEIMAIKQTIARDKEAMEFVLILMKEFEGSKQVLDNIKNKKGGSI